MVHPCVQTPKTDPMTYTFKLARRLATNGKSAALALGALLGAAACGGSATGANDVQPGTPGWLSVELTSPNTDDGAVQLRVTGPSVDSVVAASPYNGFGQSSSGSADLVLTGAIRTGTVARFHVSDISRASQYRVTVTAAAQRGSYALRSTGGYQTAVVH